MFPTSNAPLHIQSLDCSEQTDLYTSNVDIFDVVPTPKTTLDLRADQWILVEEALMEQASIQYSLSQRTYALSRFENATYLYDKASELEDLAKKVGSVIESLQANNNAPKEND